MKWDRVLLGDIAELRRDHVVPGDLGTEVVDHFSIPAFDAGRSPRREPASDIGSAKFLITNKDVLVSKLNPETPRVWLPKVQSGVAAIASTEFLVLRPTSQVDRRFLKFLCESPAVLDGLRSRVTGTTGSHQRVRARDALGISVLIPPLFYQKRIAELLGALDDKIESDRRIASHAVGLAQLEFAKVSEWLPGVPLGELAEISREQVNPSTFGQELVDHFSIPAFDQGQLPNRGSAEKILSNKFVLPPQCVLVSRLNPRFLRVWLPPVDPEVVALASTEFLVLTPKRGVNVTDLWLSTSTEEYQGQMLSRVTGTSGSHQRVRPTDAMSIVVSDVREADRTVLDECATLLQRAQVAREESANLASLCDLLLPKLLSGEVRLREAERFVEEFV